MKQASGYEPLDEAMKQRLEVLMAKTDDEIDTSEIPEWTAEDFANARPFNSLFRPRKEQITARIDADVLAWLKSHGKGYQTYMNKLLRQDMMKELDLGSH